MAYTRNINNRTRVGGSGFTAFFWRSEPIGFCRALAHTAPTPVAQPMPIQPLDEPYPIDIVTPAAQTVGSLTMELYELYNRKVWDQLSEIAGSIDLVNIFIKIAESPTPITLSKVVFPPKLRGKVGKPYADHFHNCVITNVEDGETIQIETLDLSKRITVMYTHMTRSGAWDRLDRTNKAFQYRNDPTRGRIPR